MLRPVVAVADADRVAGASEAVTGRVNAPAVFKRIRRSRRRRADIFGHHCRGWPGSDQQALARRPVLPLHQRSLAPPVGGLPRLTRATGMAVLLIGRTKSRGHAVTMLTTAAPRKMTPSEPKS